MRSGHPSDARSSRKEYKSPFGENALRSSSARSGVWFAGGFFTNGRIRAGGPRRGYRGYDDITARKKAEVSNARLAAVFNSRKTRSISKYLNGVITSWNGERILSYTAPKRC